MPWLRNNTGCVMNPKEEREKWLLSVGWTQKQIDELEEEVEKMPELPFKIYSCPYCNNGFAESNILEDHIKTYHPEAYQNTPIKGG